MQVFSGNEQVVLNVGGVKFTTTQLTLQNAPAPSLFAAMFSGRHTLKADQVCMAQHLKSAPRIVIVLEPLVYDSSDAVQNGHYFIDRDGRHFHDILNYLRVGTVVCSDKKRVLSLRRCCSLISMVAAYQP